jgi:proteasome lid subunit RPN8/RPN11
MSKKKHNRKRKYSKRTLKHHPKQITKKLKKSANDILIKMVAARITRSALYDMMNTIGSRPVETGGVLLGPVGKNLITHFYFDHSAACTGSTYSPDCATINRKLHEYWEPAGLEIKGVSHSHPGNSDSLTDGDMSYIKRLMTKSLDIDMFVAPIVLPNHYAIRPLVVTRDKLDHAQQAYFEIVE